MIAKVATLAFAIVILVIAILFSASGWTFIDVVLAYAAGLLMAIGLIE